MVLAFDFTGGSLPAGSGTLATLSFDGSVDGIDLSLSGVVVSSASGATLVSDDSADTSVTACENVDADAICDSVDDCVGAYD